MKKVLLLLVAFATIGVANAQDSFDDPAPMMDLGGSGFELELNSLGIAISDGWDSVSGQGIQVSPSFDFFSGGFKFAPEVDLNLIAAEGQVAFGILPGVKIGHDNIYFVGSYNFTLETPYYGLGGSIPLGNGNAINLSFQGGSVSDLGIGYATVGYALKF